jgi:hypothetical protein
MFELGKLELFPKSSRTVRFANCSNTPLPPTQAGRTDEGEKGGKGAKFAICKRAWENRFWCSKSKLHFFSILNPHCIIHYGFSLVSPSLPVRQPSPVSVPQPRRTGSSRIPWTDSFLVVRRVKDSWLEDSILLSIFAGKREHSSLKPMTRIF